ncbi:RNA polymerase sigma factor [Candidatus Fermentibacteria bacterium]|nr:RNA polymerase sigma factor [Candidatus Fermentibacteria bacterium]
MISSASALDGRSAGIVAHSPPKALVLTLDPDRADIDACLRGEHDAFARIVRRYEQSIARQLWRFTRDRDELEDLIQEVFVEAYRGLRSYRSNAPLLHWLRRIGTRVGYRHWKRRERDAAAIDWGSVEGFPSPEEQAPSEAAEYLFRVFGRLPSEDRLVLTLLYFEECSTQEIATRTGWSRALVKVRAFRARKRLKALMEQAGYREVTP